jgi:hypothetical protein
VITIPIDVSEGTSVVPQEYKLGFTLLTRSDQKSELVHNQKALADAALRSGGTGPTPAQHWINGYTPDRSSTTGPIESKGTVRIQKDLPVTKYLRWEVPGDLVPGSYRAQIELDDEKGNKLDEQFIEIGIHVPLRYSAGITADGHVVIRDIFGNRTSAQDAWLLKKGNDGRYTLAYFLEPLTDGALVAAAPNRAEEGDIVRAKIINGSPIDLPLSPASNASN